MSTPPRETTDHARHRIARSRLRPGLVDRPRLTRALVGREHVPVVVIAAGAGYGKTTLVAQWEARDRRPFAWVSIEAEEADIAEVLRAIALSLDAAIGLPRELIPMLGVPSPALARTMIPRLVAAIRDGGPVVLVLDDYHLIRDAATDEAVAGLAEWMPEGSQLLIVTRIDPVLPLARWRGRGQLVELRATDLAFDLEEAGAMLGAAGIALDQESIGALVERTEGWAAGLYLATLLAGTEEPAALVRRFSEDQRHVIEYLSDEVLAGLPRRSRDFMVGTSVLRRLSAPLCDAVLRRSDGARRLDELVRSNFLLVPVGEGSGWYRYHHLFADLLLAELRRSDPGLEPELHRRAAAWWAANGDDEEAVVHALAAQDWPAATRLATRAWPAMLAVGRAGPFLAWLERIPGEELRAFPPAVVCAAQAAMLGGQMGRAVQLLELVDERSWDGPAVPGSASFESAMVSVRARVAPYGVTAMRRDAERVLTLEPEGSRARPIAHAMRAVALMLGGDDRTALEQMTLALELWDGADPAQSLPAQAWAGVIAHRLGDTAAGVRAVDSARARTDALGLGDARATTLTAAARAAALADTHRMNDAVDEAEEALRLALGTSATWAEILVRITVAPPLALGGHIERAECALAEAREILAGWPDPGRLPEWLEESAARVRRASRTSLTDALNGREQEILAMLPTPLSMREIARRLYLSVNTVRTHNRSLYRKLGVSSRAEAVERARAIGLIDSGGAVTEHGDRPDLSPG
jgi:LuxR family maltose regulon positive regulatory protein